MEPKSYSPSSSLRRHHSGSSLAESIASSANTHAPAHSTTTNTHTASGPAMMMHHTGGGGSSAGPSLALPGGGGGGGGCGSHSVNSPSRPNSVSAGTMSAAGSSYENLHSHVGGGGAGAGVGGASTAPTSVAGGGGGGGAGTTFLSSLSSSVNTSHTAPHTATSNTHNLNNSSNIISRATQPTSSCSSATASAAPSSSIHNSTVNNSRAGGSVVAAPSAAAAAAAAAGANAASSHVNCLESTRFRLSPHLQPLHYDLYFAPDYSIATFTGKARIQLAARQPFPTERDRSRIVLHAMQLRVRPEDVYVVISGAARAEPACVAASRGCASANAGEEQCQQQQQRQGPESGETGGSSEPTSRRRKSANPLASGSNCNTPNAADMSSSSVSTSGIIEWEKVVSLAAAPGGCGSPTHRPSNNNYHHNSTSTTADVSGAANRGGGLLSSQLSSAPITVAAPGGGGGGSGYPYHMQSGGGGLRIGSASSSSSYTPLSSPLGRSDSARFGRAPRYPPEETQSHTSHHNHNANNNNNNDSRRASSVCAARMATALLPPPAAGGEACDGPATETFSFVSDSLDAGATVIRCCAIREWTCSETLELVLEAPLPDYAPTTGSDDNNNDKDGDGSRSGGDAAAAAAAAPPRMTLVIAHFSGVIHTCEQSVGLFYCSRSDRSALATHLEPASARTLFPCFDEPWIASTFQLTVRVPAHERPLTVVSNTPVLRDAPCCPPGDAASNAAAAAGGNGSSSSLANSPLSVFSSSLGTAGGGLGGSRGGGGGAGGNNSPSPSRTFTHNGSIAAGGSGGAGAGGNGSFYNGSFFNRSTTNSNNNNTNNNNAGGSSTGNNSTTNLMGSATTNNNNNNTGSGTYGGAREVTFEKTPALHTCIIGFDMGHFAVLEQYSRKRSLLCRVLFPSREPANSGWYALDLLTKAVDFFDDFFGVALPLKKLDLVAVEEFGSLGMENWGMINLELQHMLVSEHTALRRRQRIARLIGHEVCHMWFGDWVAISWWRYLWLKEGMSRYLEFYFADSVNPSWGIWNEFVGDILDAMLVVDADAEQAHPVQFSSDEPQHILDSFDVISYAKGAAVLRLLFSIISTAQLRGAAHLLMTRHGGGHFGVREFRQCVRDACEMQHNLQQQQQQQQQQPIHPRLQLLAFLPEHPRQLQLSHSQHQHQQHQHHQRSSSGGNTHAALMGCATVGDALQATAADAKARAAAPPPLLLGGSHTPSGASAAAANAGGESCQQPQQSTHTHPPPPLPLPTTTASSLSSYAGSSHSHSQSQRHDRCPPLAPVEDPYETVIDATLGLADVCGHPYLLVRRDGDAYVLSQYAMPDLSVGLVSEVTRRAAAATPTTAAAPAGDAEADGHRRRADCYHEEDDDAEGENAEEGALNHRQSGGGGGAPRVTSPNSTAPSGGHDFNSNSMNSKGFRRPPAAAACGGCCQRSRKPVFCASDLDSGYGVLPGLSDVSTGYNGGIASSSSTAAASGVGGWGRQSHGSSATSAGAGANVTGSENGANQYNGNNRGSHVNGNYSGGSLWAAAAAGGGNVNNNMNYNGNNNPNANGNNYATGAGAAVAAAAAAAARGSGLRSAPKRESIEWDPAELLRPAHAARVAPLSNSANKDDNHSQNDASGGGGGDDGDGPTPFVMPLRVALLDAANTCTHQLMLLARHTQYLPVPPECRRWHCCFVDVGVSGVVRCDYDHASWRRIFEVAPFLHEEDRLNITMTLFRLRFLHVGHFAGETEAQERCTLLLEWLMHVTQQPQCMNASLWLYIAERLLPLVVLVNGYYCRTVVREFIGSLFHPLAQRFMLSFCAAEKTVSFQSLIHLPRTTVLRIMTLLTLCGAPSIQQEAEDALPWVLGGFYPHLYNPGVAATGVGSGGSGQMPASSLAGYGGGGDGSNGATPRTQTPTMPFPGAPRFFSATAPATAASNSNIAGGPLGMMMGATINNNNNNNTVSPLSAAGSGGSGSGAARGVGGGGGGGFPSAAVNARLTLFDAHSGSDVEAAAAALLYAVVNERVSVWAQAVGVLLESLGRGSLRQTPAAQHFDIPVPRMPPHAAAAGTHSGSHPHVHGGNGGNSGGNGNGGNGNGGNGGAFECPPAIAIRVTLAAALALDDEAAFPLLFSILRCFAKVSELVETALLHNGRFLAYALARADDLPATLLLQLIDAGAAALSNSNAIEQLRAAAARRWQRHRQRLGLLVPAPTTGGGDAFGNHHHHHHHYSVASAASGGGGGGGGGHGEGGDDCGERFAPELLAAAFAQMDVNCRWMDYSCDHYEKFLRERRAKHEWGGPLLSGVASSHMVSTPASSVDAESINGGGITAPGGISI